MGKIVIYIIKSLTTDRTYVGSTINFEQRKKDHLTTLRNNKHHSQKLQNHVNKYSLEDIYFEILEECEVEKLVEREQFYLDTIDSYFNTAKIAENSLRGLVKTKEWGENISKSKKGVNTSTEYSKQRVKGVNTGRIVTDETRQKLKECYKGTGMTGKSHSIETKLKMSKSQEQGGHFKNRKHTNESIQKMIASRTGQKRKPYKTRKNA